MKFLTLYLQLHQPVRLHQSREKFLWEEINKESFIAVSETCYLPAIATLTNTITSYPAFKIALSMAGTFLEQAEKYSPALIESFHHLIDKGSKNKQIEILDETYFHSLASLYEDPIKQEFRDQVSFHRDKIRRLFDIIPKTFRNTDLIYNNEIADTVADMGYQAIICEKINAWHISQQETPSLFRAQGNNLLAIVRNQELSKTFTFLDSHSDDDLDRFVANVAADTEKTVLLGFSIESIMNNTEKLICWKNLSEKLIKHPKIKLYNPSDIIDVSNTLPLPVLDIPSADLSEYFETKTQQELFKDIEKMYHTARKTGQDLLKKWRHLTAADHIHYLGDNSNTKDPFYAYPNPYYESTTQAAHVLTRRIDYLETVINVFEILKKGERTAILMITPETGKLPPGMGVLAQYISGKSGGMGEVVTALCEGLTERNIDVHLAIISLKKRFQVESHVDETKWQEIRHNIDPDRIHLISSAIFSNLPSAYAGDPVLNAAEFQKEIINNTIKTVRAKSKGKLIIHSHDWMAGGAITAYAKSRQIPTLHTVHNTFTGNIPLEMLVSIELDKLSQYLYYSEEHGKRCIDCQATAIKNATIVNFVGQRFLEEVVNDFFSDRNIIPLSVRNEVKMKYYFDSAVSIINAPAHNMYPEYCDALIKSFGPDENAIAAKRENLLEFQKRTGLNLNPHAILFYWPSRLDTSQKGVELLEHIALQFAIEHDDIQIAIVADGVGNDRSHEDILGRIAFASGGKITYQHYNSELSMLGFAAASDVFGASLYEPCGQIDQIGNLFGATATNRDTGGYHDKIRELRLKVDGAPQNVGNGFLFRDYDPQALWYGLEKSVNFHRKPAEIKVPQIIRIMKEARENYDLRNMIVEYIKLYERLNGDKPLA